MKNLWKINNELMELLDNDDNITEFIKTNTPAVVEHLDYLTNMVKIAKEKKAEIDDYMKSTKNKIERLKEQCITFMDASKVDKLEGDFYSLKLRKPTKVISITDESKIPNEFKQVEVKIKKSEVKSALKNGEIIEGAKLIDGKRSLHVKINL